MNPLSSEYIKEKIRRVGHYHSECTIDDDAIIFIQNFFTPFFDFISKGTTTEEVLNLCSEHRRIFHNTTNEPEYSEDDPVINEPIISQKFVDVEDAVSYMLAISINTLLYNAIASKNRIIYGKRNYKKVNITKSDIINLLIEKFMLPIY